MVVTQIINISIPTIRIYVMFQRTIAVPDKLTTQEAIKFLMHIFSIYIRNDVLIYCRTLCMYCMTKSKRRGNHRKLAVLYTVLFVCVEKIMTAILLPDYYHKYRYIFQITKHDHQVHEPYQKMLMWTCFVLYLYNFGWRQRKRKREEENRYQCVHSYVPIPYIFLWLNRKFFVCMCINLVFKEDNMVISQKNMIKKKSRSA